MFNRANKMTALLVAAAAVVSLVPATGVNAADVKRISSEDGKVYHAVAYKDGQFYVDGEVNDKDEAAYYLADGKYSELEDVDSNSEAKVYGEKYVNIEDGDYFVDLTNGKVTDEDIKEENKDDAKSALKKKVKDKADERYADHKNEIGLDEIESGNKFGETWYAGKYEAADETNGKEAYNTDNTNKLNVYTDAKGNYIDADYNLGKIKVKPTTGSAVNVENTDKKYNCGKDDAGKEHSKNLTAKVVENAILGQDSKNIYRYATITLTSKDQPIEEVNGIEVSKLEATEGNTVVTLDVIQKISKDQASDTIDGAKYAKTVSTYAVTEDDATIDDGDVVDFIKLLEAVKNNKAESTIVNGKVVIYTTDKSIVGKDKDKDKIYAQVASLKTKAGWYYTDCEGVADSDIETATSYNVDVDGNLWIIDSGVIYKFDNEDDWDKVYKVDGKMINLSVYNKDNMVVWSDEDDEVYSVIGQKEDKEEEKPEVTVKTGWNQAADGTWTFVNADNTKATGWFQDGANWYLANAAGIMQTEWQTVNGTWFYLGSNGAMQTGWQNINGAWYYLNPVSDGTRGAMKTGWINDNGTWYFADGSGKMLANTTVNGYVLAANGAWVK
ncbi:N-acetylmuramoyl-L-alanine amidase family protein [Clostridium sp. CMCC3677]|uniref:N-acetylmuramoyl-L-alanine amidase family protein n=1 Tax=Clostridium sp. CMCC3677 TaxID=2949963 RepID=UPI0013F0457A|nr:N-acetylmuramoyl-L-alanine amidase family protein [Clostridium sp. CMCC3677]NFG60749.1 N-acetylmuramoyl-L-alanine amidase family protein [Clostridium botulinum]NFQ08183.1 N-acetylmuramoyl-L-alanine amidase family protein [Clostridium botulinum]